MTHTPREWRKSWDGTYEYCISCGRTQKQKHLKVCVFSRVDKLEAINTELLEALDDALQTAEFEEHPFRPWHNRAKDAIKKARAT